MCFGIKTIDGLIGANFRLERYSNAWVDGIKVKVQLKIGMFKQALCEVIDWSPLSECFMEKAIMSYLARETMAANLKRFLRVTWIYSSMVTWGAHVKEYLPLNQSS